MASCWTYKLGGKWSEAAAQDLLVINCWVVSNHLFTTFYYCYYPIHFCPIKLSLFQPTNFTLFFPPVLCAIPLRAGESELVAVWSLATWVKLTKKVARLKNKQRNKQNPRFLLSSSNLIFFVPLHSKILMIVVGILLGSKFNICMATSCTQSH